MARDGLGSADGTAADGRAFPVRAHLGDVVHDAFGGRRALVEAVRVRGGSKKGVYRLVLDDGSTVVAYVWDASENYWPADGPGGPDDHADPFSAASGLGLFLAAHRRLSALGLRTPRVHWSDGSRARHPADVAVVEDVTGPTLEHLLRQDPRAAAPVVRRFADDLAVLHGCRHRAFGKVALLDQGGRSHGTSCEQTVLRRALTDLTEAAGRDPRVTAAHERLRDALHGAAAAVAPRAEHSLIHGELGPDHVLVDGEGRPVLIDIEGLMFFDVEWEHVFLRLRFGPHYADLRPPSPRGPDAHTAPDAPHALDAHRLALYDLAMRLSLVAGPLRLLDGDFPDRAFMSGIAEHNLQAALALVGLGGRGDRG
ncbi:phosphotransferase family protein [Actinacidiphila acidipaludis]|uniref:Aminoglycoside phosphotransferase family protein n=1 Tax=Actinacidiphila acidipaludis TaxID=2873382 RepID=A0ABS7QA98_9ACTN|nr:phosphotransferase [Streptomyces acidipaludis]MBY8880078.1 aminoglycoside phosphotransferase family protein [Streptomyces acidipaludis]